MKISTFFRHIRESFRNIIRNSWMTFASVSAVTVTLLLVGVFVVLMLNMNKIATDIEEDVEVKVFIDLEADEAAIQELGKNLESIAGVANVEYSSKEQELQNLIEDLGEDFSLFEQDNPLYNTYTVKAVDPRRTDFVADQASTYDFVNSVEYGEERVEQLFSFFEVARNVGLVLIVGLLFTAMFLISNTIKITIVARRKEIEIMKLVGATNWFVRWPFILEGLWLGMLGSVIPISLITTGYIYGYDLIQPKLENYFFSILDVTPFIYQVNIIILLLGSLIGVWGSMMSVRKFLKI
ncbi:cell division protein FtsX [Bacillus coahuilensis p1.1.43]|uniref:Cell division protein FtsX n=1 Tax=Bacillus coahuilensis p1.1.43 TaxID=1150625 RepID=A0A147K648_9BACI|nr:permease-like cell division protein FtsX [Bacillus coahuilensis]KUP05238.1 cell division protein FtsX [Bacillus coahuilensis p1.1.43]